MKCLHVSGSRKTLLETFLNFCFFLCISPFRIVCGERNEIRIRQIKLQKVLAGFFALLDIFGSITKIRLNLEENLDNPVGYFHFMWSIAVTMMHVAFYFVLWSKQHHLAKAVEIFKKSFSNSYNMTKLPFNAGLGYFLCFLSLLLGILPSIKGSHLISNISMANWNPGVVIRAHVTHAKFMFFLSDTSSTNSSYYYNLENTESTSLDDLNFLEIVQGICHFIVYTARYMGAYFIDLYMFITSITLWLGANQFVQEAIISGDFQRRKETSLTASSEPIDVGEEIDRNSSNSEIVEKFADLKCLADVINDAMSPVLFCYVFEAIFYYATNLNSIFTASDWHARLQVGHFLLGFSSVMGFSADVTRKMDGFRLWLVNGTSVRKLIGSERLLTLIHETQSKTVGISAYGIFTIDYPLIFNIVTTTVTFFLIVVQFNPNTC